MIIDKIIFAVDDNPKYSGLWEINSEICKKVLGITPVLFHITEEDSDFYEDKYGIVKKIKRLPNHSTGFQSQIYRMYGTKYFPDEVCITSDIDMLTINKSYITDQIKHFNENDFIVYTSDGYDKNRPECVDIYCDPRVSMCYNAGKGSTFNEIFNTERSFFDFANEVRETYWQEHDCDELFLGNKILNFGDQNRIKKLKRGYTSPFICPKRIERPKNEKLFNVYSKEDIKNGNIIDIHLSRPYSYHKKEIDELKRIILGEHKEVYLIVVGGLKIIETSADLAVACALISASKDISLPAKTLAIGEIGLTGEIRMIGNLETRLKEAQKLGFQNCLIPQANIKNKSFLTLKKNLPELNFIEVSHIRDLAKIITIKK
jgi:hypothetical protein